MKTGNDIEQLQIKWEVTEIMEDNEGNHSSILGHSWDKREDVLEITMIVPSENKPLTNRVILSQLSSIYDPLGIISCTVVEGKLIYREACDEKGSWNSEVAAHVKRDWIRWTRGIRKIKAIHLHLFAYARKKACSTIAITMVKHSTGVVMGLLMSKSRISKCNTSIMRLELVSGHYFDQRV